MTRLAVASRALLEAATQSGVTTGATDDEEAWRLSKDGSGEGGEESPSNKKTVVLAAISALLIVALVIYGCFRMCRSASTMERAANFLTSYKGTSRAEGSYMSYTSNSDGSNFKDAPMPQKPLPQAKPVLPTLPED